MNRKKLLAGILSLAMAVGTPTSFGASVVPAFGGMTTAYAEETVSSGDAATSDEENNGPEKVTLDGGVYTVYSDHAVLTETSSPDSELVIPDNINGVPVTELGDRSLGFSYNTEIVRIPASVTRIGDHLCGYCPKLDKLIVDENNPNYCSVDGVIYTKDKKSLIAYPGGHAETDFTVPDFVETIAYGACYNANIENITIPASVKKIDKFGFVYCKSLKSVKLSEGLESIGYHAFWNAVSLTSIEIPASVTEIDRCVFEECKSLADIYIYSPDCKIPEKATTLGVKGTTVIHAAADSTARTFAETAGFAFKSLDGTVEFDAVMESASTTTTTATTTTTSNTTTTTASNTTTTTTAETTTATTTTASNATTTTTAETTTATTTTASNTTTATTAETTTATSAVTTTAEVTTAPEVSTEPTLAERVVGTWNFKEFVDESGAPIDDLKKTNATVSFNSDGTGYMEVVSTEVENEKSSLTWTIDDNKVKVSQPGYAENEFIWFSLSDDGHLQGIRADGLLIFEREPEKSGLGDANGDSGVDAKDASFILVAYGKASTGSDDGLTDAQRAASDVNADGKVDAKDASAILSYYSYLSTGGTDSLEAYLKK